MESKAETPRADGSPHDKAGLGEATPVRTATTRCPFCHAEVQARAESWVVCAFCLARHHEGCWSESRDRCASCGEASGLRPDGAAKAGSQRPTVDGALLNGLKGAALTLRICALTALLGLVLYRGQNALILSVGGKLPDIDLGRASVHTVHALPEATTEAWFAFAWSVAYLLAFLGLHAVLREPVRGALDLLRRAGYARAAVDASGRDGLRAIRDAVRDLGEKQKDAGKLDVAIECLELARDLEANPGALEPWLLGTPRSARSVDDELKLRNRIAVLEALRIVDERSPGTPRETAASKAPATAPAP